MKQGTTRKLKPKSKKDKKSWQKRNAARESKRIAYQHEQENIAIEVEFNRFAAEEAARGTTTEG